MSDIVKSFNPEVGFWEAIIGGLTSGDKREQKGIHKVYGGEVSWVITLTGNQNKDDWKTSKANMYLVMTAKTVTALDWTTNKLSHKIYQISVWGGGSPNPQLIILNFVDKSAWNKTWNYLKE